MGLLEGKIALVTGIANKNSIAYGIAQAFKREGAQLILTYANEKIGKKIEPIAQELGPGLLGNGRLLRPIHRAGL